MDTPLDGLVWFGAAEMSLEELVIKLQQSGQDDAPCWNAKDFRKRPEQGSSNPSSSSSIMSQALKAAGLLVSSEAKSDKPIERPIEEPVNLPQGLDVLLEDDEAALLGQQPQESASDRMSEILSEVSKSQAQRAIAKHLLGKTRGTMPGQDSGSFVAIRALYDTPWERALQHWLESNTPGQRTFARPSRRNYQHADLCLPGRRREGWTLNLVIDTSGSMYGSLSKVLGAIEGFCQSNGIDDVRIIQCDTNVTVDERVEVESLANYRISGLGGSDMSSAMQRLAEDPEVTAAIVLTDGYIAFPQDPPPYSVFWAIVNADHSFRPNFGYGEVVFLQVTNQEGMQREIY